MEQKKPYYPLTDYIKEKYRERVFKVTLDAGLTCPNRDGTVAFEGCVYCDPSTLVPRPFDGTLAISEQLALGIEKVGRRHRVKKFIAYYQINTNTHAGVEELRKLYAPALAHPDVVALAVSTRPDCLGPDVIALLKEISRKKDLWVELGLQSSNPDTLKFLNRGHTHLDFKAAVERLNGAGIDACAHIIIGLPGEGRANVLGTIRFLAGLKVWGIKFHQMQVLKDTPLEKMYLRGELKPLCLDEYAALVIECLEMLPPGTVIHRLSGDVPVEYLVAPKWGANKFIVTERIIEMMAAKGASQGAMARQAYEAGKRADK
jgi:radical SAM protein (TIGR01212 family)